MLTLQQERQLRSKLALWKRMRDGCLEQSRVEGSANKYCFYVTLLDITTDLEEILDGNSTVASSTDRTGSNSGGDSV
jgi:hypothetical protein